MEKVKKKKETPFERKSCYECGHLKSYVSWWCGNKEAVKARGTAIPGCIHCPYWKPDWDMIKDKHKTIENGYVEHVYKKYIDFMKIMCYAITIVTVLSIIYFLRQ